MSPVKPRVCVRVGMAATPSSMKMKEDEVDVNELLGQLRLSEAEREGAVLASPVLVECCC